MCEVLSNKQTKENMRMYKKGYRDKAWKTVDKWVPSIAVTKQHRPFPVNCVCIYVHLNTMFCYYSGIGWAVMRILSKQYPPDALRFYFKNDVP